MVQVINIRHLILAILLSICIFLWAQGHQQPIIKHFSLGNTSLLADDGGNNDSGAYPGDAQATQTPDPGESGPAVSGNGSVTLGGGAQPTNTPSSGDTSNNGSGDGGGSSDNGGGDSGGDGDGGGNG